MQGKRIENNKWPNKQGEYSKWIREGDKDIKWMFMPPKAGYGLSTLSLHKIIEHEDNSITVEGSILVKGKGGSWHGYLEKGIWREA